ncbi:long-chain-fatty-acid--CoA ligase [Ottowia thiooxydans]|uniref:long-chain-fatty-acid--CoA ligase n=1 Tax=Ottowia thiooxydans TaxID=219182 RepID=UPI0004207DAE|nr:long-chain-fatty-acid--CoA ligase [Ottowia thiooxydans]
MTKNQSSMMERPLLISSILEHGAAQHATQEVVSRETHGTTVRHTYAQIARRVRKLANALRTLGLKEGDAVASIAWNNHRHLEAYYAVSGSGMVMHTCNPRLHPTQLAYILNHAEDQMVLFDSTFAPLVAAIAPQCPHVKHWVCLSDDEHLPSGQGSPTVVSYESLIATQADTFEWPEFDERTGAALCYTSGTTGNPKGVLYSHRAIVLNATTSGLPDVLGLSTREAILPVVPMFHINAWCIPYSAMLAGTKLVLPGPRLDGASLHELMESERVTISAGVPTIWMGLLQHVEQAGLRFTTMRRTCVGGSAMPRALIEKFNDVYGVEVRHGWGMTETTAIATLSNLSASDWELPAEQRHAIVARQGKVTSGIEIKVVDESGATLPRDGTSQGELMVRGHWIVERYYKAEETALVNGWFPTGDIATIDADGTMTIRDRTKDVIKSGGEWISSIDLENAVVAHPGVAMAAVIGIKHPKWDERPLLLVVRKPGQDFGKNEVLEFLSDRVAKWWMPEDVVFLETLPVGGTGKVQKNELRKQYGGLFTEALP